MVFGKKWATIYLFYPTIWFMRFSTARARTAASWNSAKFNEFCHNSVYKKLAARVLGQNVARGEKNPTWEKNLNRKVYSKSPTIIRYTVAIRPETSGRTFSQSSHCSPLPSLSAWRMFQTALIITLTHEKTVEKTRTRTKQLLRERLPGSSTCKSAGPAMA